MRTVKTRYVTLTEQFGALVEKEVSSTTETYNRAGNITESLDYSPDGRTQRGEYSYDGKGNLIEVRGYWRNQRELDRGRKAVRVRSQGINTCRRRPCSEFLNLPLRP